MEPTYFHNIPIVTDDSLPKGYYKLLGGGLATVFRVEEDDSVEIVATWPEDSHGA